MEVDANKVDWTPTGRPGILCKLLRSDAATGARPVLLKLEASSRLPQHRHPAGEDVFVPEGRVRFEEIWSDAGYYLYSPLGSADDVYTDAGAILFVALPKPHLDLE